MKKRILRILSSLLVVVMIVGSAPLSGFVGLDLPNWANLFTLKADAATESGTCGDNLTWSLDTETGVLEISGTDNMYNWTDSSDVPWYSNSSSIKTVVIGNSVTSIGGGAFSDCDSLTSVTIPDSVTSIGNFAFQYCYSLASVTIGNSVKSIGNYAFYSCDSLTSVTIPDSVTSIGDNAFGGCTSLTSVTIGKSVINIGEGAFSWCLSLTSITVKEGNPNYSSDEYGVLFNKDKTELILYPAGNTRTSYTIPDSVTRIGYGAFGGCTGLTSVTIPDSVTSIGYGAFVYCHSLTSVTIPNSVTSIGDYAFGYCISLTSVTIPDSVISIGNDAFEYCFSLASVTIGNSVKSIGNYAFSSCTGLTSVTIPDSVTNIGDHAFSVCTNLTSITVKEDNPNYSSDEYGVLFNKDKTELIQYPAGNTRTSYAITNSVTSIGRGAFYYCTSLTSVTIPDSVTRIGDFAFYNTEIYNNSSNWENDVLYIGNHLIKAKSSITGDYTIKSGTKIIADRAFYDCTRLTSITVDSNNGYYSSDSFGVLYNKDKTELIQYPIGNSSTSFTIPDSVISIGNDAFYDCYSLTSVTIPDSVISIGNNAFYGCYSLTSITIPDSVTSIGQEAFYNTGIYNNSSNWENNVLYIGNHLIKATSNITGDYAIKSGTKTIAGSAFEDCGNLTSVTIPDSVTSIGDYAFNSCTSLTNVYYTGTQEQWKKIYIGSYNTCLTNATIHFSGDESSCSHTSYTEHTISATCGVDGESYKLCNDCGEKFDVTVIPALGHSYGEWATVSAPNCLDDGVESRKCTRCNHEETRTVAALGHTAGEWEVVKEATADETGEKVRKCVRCALILETEIIPKLEVVIDADSGISVAYTPDAYESAPELVVEETNDGTVFTIINTEVGANRNVVCDISLTVNGVQTQPNGKVTVKIPIPEGYNPERTFIYHVNTETGKVENMNAVAEGDFLVFTTDHFSYYAIVEEYDIQNFAIPTPSTTTIKYGDSIILHTEFEGTLPDGARIEWTADNDCFSMVVSEDGTTCEISPKSSGKTTFTVTVYDADGNEIVSSSQEMTSKAGFFYKFIAFFKKLFGLLKVIPYTI